MVTRIAPVPNVTHRCHIEQFQNVQVRLRGVVFRFGVCRRVGRGSAIRLRYVILFREILVIAGSHGHKGVGSRYAPTILLVCVLEIIFPRVAVTRPRFVAWNASVTFAGAMVAESLRFRECGIGICRVAEANFQK